MTSPLPHQDSTSKLQQTRPYPHFRPSSPRNRETKARNPKDSRPGRRGKKGVRGVSPSPRGPQKKKKERKNGKGRKREREEEKNGRPFGSTPGRLWWFHPLQSGGVIVFGGEGGAGVDLAPLFRPNVSTNPPSLHGTSSIRGSLHFRGHVAAGSVSLSHSSAAAPALSRVRVQDFLRSFLRLVRTVLVSASFANFVVD